jgi:flavorubredoxin
MSEEQSYDYMEPIEVAPGIYWAGFYDEQASFHCNPYLLVDGDEAVLFDPAGVIDYPKVASKVLSVVEAGQINYIVVHHQDPDLCASIPLLEDVISNKNLKIVAHSRARILIHHYGVQSEFYEVDQHQYSLTLESGRCLRFLTTPFCHSPAGIVTYDEKEKILFSSDLFGAVSRDWHLFARAGYQQQMESFHQGYMASHQHLEAVINHLSKLDLRMILPQHGSIIQEAMISPCMEFLKELRCGIDVSAMEEELHKWIPH